MIIDSFNDYVFTDVKKWLTAKFSDNRDYDHTCVVLGSAASKMTP
jgi:hypothetical protein